MSFEENFRDGVDLHTSILLLPVIELGLLMEYMRCYHMLYNSMSLGFFLKITSPVAELPLWYQRLDRFPSS